MSKLIDAPNLRRFDSRAELDTVLAETIATGLQAGVEQRGGATLVVSGGSTPKGLFAQLADKAIDWPAVTVLLADERWVEPTHPDRNEAMLRERLLVNKATDATLIPLITQPQQPEASLTALRDALAALATFDVVVLGMGGDGHTASLFPCAPELEAGLTTDQDALLTNPTTAPHRRVSLSLQRLRRTRLGLVHITGDDKLRVLEQARDSGDPKRFPIAAFLDQFSVWYAN